MDKKVGALATLLGVLGSISSASAANILVLIDGIDVGKGSVFMRFCDAGPLDECQQFGAVQFAGYETVGFRFSDIPPSEYAFVAFQDLDSSGQAERNFIGMPKEPFALSNDAGEQLIPPPSFEDLKIPVADGDEITVRLTMQTVTASKKAEGAPVLPVESIPVLEVADPVPQLP